MFDNLKKKLGSFRKDAEAAAEENVEEVSEEGPADVSEEELDDDSPAPADEDAVDDASADAASDAEPDEPPSEEAIADAEADSVESDGAEADSVESDGAEADSVESDSAEADSVESDGAEADDTVADRAPGDADSEPIDVAEPDSDSDGAASGSPDVAEADTVADPESSSTEPVASPEPTESSEPAGEPEPDAEPAPETEVDAESVSEPEGEGAAEPTATESDAEPEPEPEVPPPEQRSSPMTGSPMTGGSSSSQRSTGRSTTESQPADDDGGQAVEDGEDTGIGRKAKSLVKGKFVIDEGDLDGPLHELELALLSGDVEMGVAEEILDNIREELVGETRTFTTSTGQVVEEALRDAIYDVISVGQFDFDERIAIEDKPVTIVFTGVNGVGKTTSIAKMSRYFEERGYSTVMANGDTYRAGANEQIQEHADALDTKCISHQQGGDPAAVLYDAVEYAEANDIDIVLGDTAGRLHTDEGLMDQLEKIGRVVDPDMTLFVDEAVAGQDAVNRAREFNEAVEMDGAILTKADADSNGGAAISIAHVTGKPILFLGTGQEYDHLERFDPEEMADRLIED